MIWRPCHFRAGGPDGLKVISGPGLIDISEPEALIASMQIRGSDGLHYSYMELRDLDCLQSSNATNTFQAL